MNRMISMMVAALALGGCMASDDPAVSNAASALSATGQSGRLAARSFVVASGTLIGEQRIAYRDNGGTGPALVLVHSNSCNADCWERQFATTLPDDSPNPLAGYRILALDLPGHGRTRRLDGLQNQYSIGFYAEAIAAFSDALGLTGAVYVGHSLGGHAVIEAANLLPDPAGALVFGTPPFSTSDQLGQAFFPMPGGPHFLLEDLSARDISYWEASVFYSEIPDWFRRAVRRTDPLARSGLAASLGVLADEIQLVRDFPAPFGIIQGEWERSVRLSYLESIDIEDELWRGEIQIVPESNHFTQYDQPEAFNVIVADLLADVN